MAKFRVFLPEPFPTRRTVRSGAVIRQLTDSYKPLSNLSRSASAWLNARICWSRSVTTPFSVWICPFRSVTASFRSASAFRVAMSSFVALVPAAMARLKAGVASSKAVLIRSNVSVSVAWTSARLHRSNRSKLS